MTERIQVAVVGGGPAGLSAAIAAAEHGAGVVSFDENGESGGQLRYRTGLIDLANDSANGPRTATWLAKRATAAGVDMRPDSRVWGVFHGKTLGVEANRTTSVAEAERIVLTTGSVDRACPFPGGSLPGVFTARAVQLLLNCYAVLPGRRFALIAGESEASELTRDIERAGGEVVAVIPPGSKSLRALGDSGVEQLIANDHRYGVDVIVVAVGRLADAGLALMAECGAGSWKGAAFVPKVDDRLETTVGGIYAAGDAIGPTSIDVAIAEGTYAGVSVAASLRLVSDTALVEARAAYVEATSDRAHELARVSPVHVQIDRVPPGAHQE